MQSLREIRHVWLLHIFNSARPSLKTRAYSRTESDIFAPSQYLIPDFVQGWGINKMTETNYLENINKMFLIKPSISNT